MEENSRTAEEIDTGFESSLTFRYFHARCFKGMLYVICFFKLCNLQVGMLIIHFFTSTVKKIIYDCSLQSVIFLINRHFPKKKSYFQNGQSGLVYIFFNKLKIMFEKFQKHKNIVELAQNAPICIMVVSIFFFCVSIVPNTFRVLNLL